MGAVVGVMGGDDGLAVGQLAQFAAVPPLHAHGVLTLLGQGRVVQAEHAVLGVRACPLEHQGDAFAVQVVGLPGAIDQEILELLQGGFGQDLGVLAGQVRDQAEEVMGAVLDPLWRGKTERKSETKASSCERSTSPTTSCMADLLGKL